ncbi:hypothetical protein MJ579_17995 [Klebsiella pneumoniae]|nr:hypothetical protein MJ579_17995 [Klebsiella pneumoniae]
MRANEESNEHTAMAMNGTITTWFKDKGLTNKDENGCNQSHVIVTLILILSVVIAVVTFEPAHQQ